jgi:hypothetical protein
LESGQHRTVVDISGEHDDRHARVPRGEQPGGLDPVQDGHVQVEQDGVRLVFGYPLERLFPVGGGGHDVDAG